MSDKLWLDRIRCLVDIFLENEWSKPFNLRKMDRIFFFPLIKMIFNIINTWRTYIFHVIKKYVPKSYFYIRSKVQDKPMDFFFFFFRTKNFLWSIVELQCFYLFIFLIFPLYSKGIMLSLHVYITITFFPPPFVQHEYLDKVATWVSRQSSQCYSAITMLY